MSSQQNSASGVRLATYTFEVCSHDPEGKMGRITVDIEGFRIEGAIVSAGIAEAVLGKLNEAIALVQAEQRANGVTLVELARHRMTPEARE